jgi:hypothetical protein
MFHILIWTGEICLLIAAALLGTEETRLFFHFGFTTEN